MVVRVYKQYNKFNTNTVSRNYKESNGCNFVTIQAFVDSLNFLFKKILDELYYVGL
jgi:hypothetical protein